jgi:DNA-directed RNA polymerase subunit RPC12/RpoP
MRNKTRGRITSSNNDDRVIISSEYFEDDRPSYICSICNQTLIRLTDAGMNNTSFWCRNCSVEFNPEEENVRRESKLSVPDRNIEPAVATTPGIPDISIHHKRELEWGARELSKKGTIKFTSYEER